MKYIKLLFISLLSCVIATGQYIRINEFSQGTSGAKEWVELVVSSNSPVNNTNCILNKVSISGWILDDNNGDFSPSNHFTGSGIASGHIRFRNVAPWNNLPVGAIIVIYNAADRDVSIPADDPFDWVNNDCVYIVPSNHSSIEYCTTLPIATNCTTRSDYAACSYVTTGNWNNVSLANAGDAIQIRNPSFNLIHGLVYGKSTSASGCTTTPDMVGNTSAPLISNLAMSLTAASFIGTTDADYFDATKWSIIPANTATPGAPNNAANQTYINNTLRGGCTCNRILPITSVPQTRIFTLDPNPAISLDGAVGSCSTPGSSTPNAFSIPVSGVGDITSTNQLLLASIALSDCGTGTKNFNAVQIRLISPSGQCYGIYSGGLTTLGGGIHYLNLVSSTNCLNNPNTSNDANGGAPFTSTGNNGYFNAQFNGIPTLYSNYTGSADGNWRVVFSETTANPPCVESIRLFFGDPSVIPQGTTGDNCINPIVWDGKSPICASTGGMTGSTQMPGSIGGPSTNTFGTIGGVTCGWNFANNNDVWIKYTAAAANTCLSISGISGTSVSLQSIVVTDANRDNDNNPCTQVARTSTNDPNWQVVSCPRPSIYGTTAGTQFNQQHCFTSEIGKTYYLVVDGDGGAVSKFWIWGFSYNGILKLQDYTNVTPTIINTFSIINANGVLITKSKKTHKQRVIVYNSAGSLLYESKLRVIKESKLDLNQYMKTGLNIIRVIIDDNSDVFTFKHIKN